MVPSHQKTLICALNFHQIPIRSAHAADPVNSLRRNSLRHQTLETPLCRFYKVPIPWTQRHPRGPKGTQRAQGKGEGPKGGQGNPRDPRGPKGTHGVPRGPKGAFGALGGGDGPMGPFGVIAKPFRMECHFEWKVITKGNPLRNESRG